MQALGHRDTQAERIGEVGPGLRSRTRTGSSRRPTYYEADGAQPPGALLAELAKVLRVSADELLGLRPLRDDTPPRTARLLKRLRKVEQLAPADQRAVLKLVDALAATRRPNGQR